MPDNGVRENRSNQKKARVGGQHGGFFGPSGNSKSTGVTSTGLDFPSKHAGGSGSSNQKKARMGGQHGGFFGPNNSKSTGVTSTGLDFPAQHAGGGGKLHPKKQQLKKKEGGGPFYDGAARLVVPFGLMLAKEGMQHFATAERHQKAKKSDKSDASTGSFTRRRAAVGGDTHNASRKKEKGNRLSEPEKAKQYDQIGQGVFSALQSGGSGRESSYDESPSSNKRRNAALSKQFDKLTARVNTLLGGAHRKHHK